MVYISIKVERSPELIFLDGKIFGKSGSTTRELKGHDLRARSLKRGEEPWTEGTTSRISMSELNNGIYLDFIRKARSINMLSEDDEQSSIEEIFDKLNLSVEGNPKLGAVLLFHPEQQKFTPGAFVQIGMFRGSDILYQDMVGGPLFSMPDKIIDILFTKYMIAPISFEGIYRRESHPYPMPSIREAVLNLIMHSDYGDKVSMQIKVHADRIEMWNSGSPPENWTLETLLNSHRSIPGNPTIATVFHRAGMVEKFGRGIRTIIDGYEGRETRRPEFSFSISEFCVTFFNDSNIDDDSIVDFSIPNTCKNPLGMKDNEFAVYQLISESRFTTSSEAATLLGVSSRTVDRILSSLQTKGVIERSGSKKSGEWRIKHRDLR